MKKKTNSRQARRRSGSKLSRRAAPKSRSRTLSSRRARRQPRRILGLRWHHFGGLTLFLIGLAWLGFILEIQPSARGSADTCTISNILVNSCRPWLGAAVGGYPQVASDVESQALYHEQRIGRQLDIIHTYHPVGDNTLSSYDKYFINRPDTYLYANWKPSAVWGNIASQNSAIDSMANSIMSVSPHKIFLTIWHEPENDVTADDSAGGAACQNSITNNGLGGFKGSSTDGGTTTQYVAMWNYVENRFAADYAAKGVPNNVVWVMNYMGYQPWDCLVPDLWPGNNLVDWVTWDSYSSSDSSTWDNTTGRFYNLLETDNTSTDNFESKVWGAAEWGDCKTSDQAHIYAYYAEAKAALDDNTYPKLKMYMIYDDSGNGAGMGCLTEYSLAGVLDPTEQADYNQFADDPRFTDAFYQPAPPPADTTPPTATITAPANGATVSGDISVTSTASDNVAVGSVALYVDGTKLATDTTSPYDFTLDTANYSNGSHSLVAHATDSSGNQGQSGAVTITIDNVASSSGGGTAPTGGSGPTVISPSSLGGSNTPLAVKGTLVIAGGGQVSVDGKTQSGGAVNTTDLTNGTHMLTIVQDGKTIHKTIVVHNPWPTAIKNEIQAHRVAYSSGAGVSVITIGLGVWLMRRRISHWLLRLHPARNLARFTTSQIIKPFGK